MGKPHFVMEPVIPSSEAVFWQELERELNLLSVPCVCVFVLHMCVSVMAHSVSCGSCGSCVLSLQAV